MDLFLELSVEFIFNLITEASVRGARPIMRDFREQKYDGFTLLQLTTPSYDETSRSTIAVGLHSKS